MNEHVIQHPEGVNAAGTTPESTGSAARQDAPLRYLAALLCGMVGALAIFYFALFALLATGNLPPPAFTNSVCIDEKLTFMREHSVASPDLLVVGSSVAWRHFDGASVADASRGMRPLNAGFCGIHINQSAFVADWLVEQHPTVRHVVMITAPQDFAQCSRHPTAVFDRQDASDYVYGGASRWPYYIRYFSPGSLFANARKIKQRRDSVNGTDPLAFDRFGAGPLDTTESRPTLYYGPPEPLDSSCFQALRSLADRLQREGRSFTVVSTPLHPDWKAKEDPDGRFLDDLNARIAGAVKMPNARHWDADAEWKPPRSAFTDAVHLRWSAARTFSAALAQQLRLSSRDAAAGVNVGSQNR